MSIDGRVHLEVADGVAWVTLRNAHRKNAITRDMAAQLIDHCATIDHDQAIGAAIIDTEGDYFCSGADTAILASASADPASSEAVESLSHVYESFGAVRRLAVPTVSLVVGGAVGAGMNLVLATDLTIATVDAVFDSGFVARRIHPGGGHVALLSRRVSRQTAVAMANFGWKIDASTACTIGLVWRVADRAEHRALARDLVSRAARDPLLSRAVRESIRLEVPSDVEVDRGVEIERGRQMWSMRRKGEAGWKR